MAKYRRRVPPASRRSPRAWSIAGAGADAKLGTRVAALITDDIAALGWPTGQVIGSEADLLERYGVSRAVLREAIRLLEYQSVARNQRGRGGGLVVTEPHVGVVTDAAIIYLLRCGARLDEVFEARLVVEQVVVDVLPGRLREEDVLQLRSVIADEDAGKMPDMQTLHRVLATATRNPALAVFVDLLTRLTSYYFTSRTMSPATQHTSGTAHRKIVEAVIAGDSATAQRRMAKHLDAEAEYLRARRSARQVLDPARALRDPSGGKRGQELARQIFARVLADGLSPGDMLGFEAELMAKHDVSRGVFREAVRLLEYHHIAEMRRGGGGGLFVAEPNVLAVADVIALYLERHQVSAEYLGEARVRVELAALDRVFDQPRVGMEARIMDGLAKEAEATRAELAHAVHDLHAAIASLSGNRVIELLALVMIGLTRIQQPELREAELAATRADIHRAHSGIAAAVLAGDRRLAQHRMRRHLEVLTARL